MKRAGKYPGKIRYLELQVRNGDRDAMRNLIASVPFLGYKVESLRDGRMICITKPGGKNVYGRMKVDDFMVWIYDERSNDRWRISHGEIFEDLRGKLTANKDLGGEAVDLLEQVCRGLEPEDLLTEELTCRMAELPGERVELLLKVCKWIWAQEDVNYPSGKGRWLSMEEILRIRESLLSGEEAQA